MDIQETYRAERFGQWLKERRDKAGMTQGEFLRLHPLVSQPTLSGLENGRIKVRAATARALGKALGASALETLVAMGEAVDVSVADVHLLERVARLSDRDKRVIEQLVGLLLREK